MKPRIGIILSLFLLCIFGSSCKPDASKLSEYFNNVAGAHGIVRTEPIPEALAMEDVSNFFTNVKPKNPKTKCFVDVTRLTELLDALQAVHATGIRIYSAAYTPHSIGQAPPNMSSINANDYHLIIVPIDDNGREIKSASGVSTIYNYNNDCPFSCPTDWSIISLISESDRTHCNQ